MNTHSLLFYPILYCGKSNRADLGDYTISLVLGRHLVHKNKPSYWQVAFQEREDTGKQS